MTNVTRPTITIYAPEGKNTGAAVVVFPGGGFQILAIDLEGTASVTSARPSSSTIASDAARGRAIKFLKGYDRLEFPAAVEELAQSVGLAIPHERTGNQPTS